MRVIGSLTAVLVVLAAANARCAEARADGIDAGTQASLQAIITQQIDAFGRNDAAAAQSFAAPGIKQKFPDATAFNDMVHRAYAPLIHPKSTRFEPADMSATGPVERVTIIDAEGRVWTALYSFEQVDGQWRINGCVLVQQQSTNV